MHPAALMVRLRKDLPEGAPETQGAIAHRQLGCELRPTALEEQNAYAFAIGHHSLSFFAVSEVVMAALRQAPGSIDSNNRWHSLIRTNMSSVSVSSF